MARQKVEWEAAAAAIAGEGKHTFFCLSLSIAFLLSESDGPCPRKHPNCLVWELAEDGRSEGACV